MVLIPVAKDANRRGGPVDHQPYPEPTVKRGPAPIPPIDDLKTRLGPNRTSLRDLALGLQVGTIRLTDYTSDPDNPETWMDRWIDDGGKGGKNGGYDPMAIYTGSTNRHDHRTQIRLNLSPETLRAVKLICGMVPQFGSDGGFIRDAIVHSLQHWVARLDVFADAEVSNAVNYATMNTVIASVREALEEKKRMVEEVDELVRLAIADGDVGVVETICDAHEAIAQEMRGQNKERVLESLRAGREWAREERKREALRIAKGKIDAMKAAKREAEWVALEAAREEAHGLGLDE